MMIGLPVEVARDLHKKAVAEVGRLTKLRESSMDDVKRYETRRAEWEAILVATQPAVCPLCKGHGEVQEWDGEDCRFEKCGRCKGTGLA